eukprot:7619786-Pyramimonas_sp.AAC.1
MPKTGPESSTLGVYVNGATEWRPSSRGGVHAKLAAAPAKRAPRLRAREPLPGRAGKARATLATRPSSESGGPLEGGAHGRMAPRAPLGKGVGTHSGCSD